MKMCEHYQLRMFLTLICCYLLSNIQVVICATITEGPQDVTISAGKEATFTCIFRLNYDNVELTYDVGWNASNIIIAIGNTILNQNKYSIKETSELETDGKYITSTLKITKVNHDDAGDFSCFIIQRMAIQGLAKLIVKNVPEPHCMDLPKNVTMTDRIKLSCMIGPENYVTRLTWYEGDNSKYMNTGMFLQSKDNSYLNTTVDVSDYTNGTIFKCVAAAGNGGKKILTCSTNPLNIVEPTSLDVEVHALNPLPLTAGSQACFECRVSCGDCIGQQYYTWEYYGSARLLPSEISNRICFKSIPMNDTGRSLRCSAKFGSENGADELVLQVVDTMTTAQREIQNEHPLATIMTNTITHKLPNLGDHSCIILITVTIVIMSFLIFLIIIYYKRQMRSKKMTKAISAEYDDVQVSDDTPADKRRGRHNVAGSSPNVLINSMYRQVELNQTKSEGTLMQDHHYANVKHQ